MTVKTYNANEVTVTLAGIPISETAGYADGEFVRIERESNHYEDQVGTDGSVTRSKTNDNRATITLMLMSSSGTNDILSDLLKTDKNSNGASGIGGFLVKDAFGTTLHESDACWIQQSPSASFDREATTREWVFRVSNLVDYHGGNNVTAG